MKTESLTISTRTKLSSGQYGLLSVITKCIEAKQSLNWDIVVDCYCKSMTDTAYTERYMGKNDKGQSVYEHIPFSIKQEYLIDSNQWKYNARNRVFGWFKSTIGALVIKNKLMVLPIIEIEEK